MGKNPLHCLLQRLPAASPHTTAMAERTYNRRAGNLKATWSTLRLITNVSKDRLSVYLGGPLAAWSKAHVYA